MAEKILSHQLFDNSIMPCKIAKLDFSDGHEVDDAHRHNGFEVFLFTKAGGTHMLDFNYYPIAANSIHFLTEDQVHSLNSTDDTEGYVIVFSKEIVMLNSADKFLVSDFPVFNKSIAPVLYPGAALFEELMNLHSLMMLEYNKSSPYKENILGSLISVFLLKCKSLIHETNETIQADNAAHAMLTKFYNLLEQNFLTCHRVSDYADLMNISANHLSNTIKKITGKPAGDIIHQRLILEAKRRLLHSTISVKELAFALNFNDPSYFSRFFKKQTKYSPEEFRNEIRKKYHF